MSAPPEISAGVIAWVRASEYLPDDDETVLLYAPDASDPVWLGYRDADVWRYVDGMEAAGVTHWVPLPGGPGNSACTEARPA